MTSVPSVLNGGEPAGIGSGGDTVTLVEGGTFCLSERRGDVLAGRSHGLFFRDARVLSRWQLHVDGQPPEPLSVQTPEAFAAQFIMRRAPRVGVADSTLLLVRDRLVADGMRETISLHNLDVEPTVVALELFADADFADLFTVKEGRAPISGAELTLIDNELVLTDRANRVRGVKVTASGNPTALPGSFRWRIVVPPRGTWQAEIVVDPTWANHSIKTRFRRGEQLGSSEPVRKIEAWRDTTTTVETDDAVLAQTVRRTESDLGALLISDADGRPFVAAGAPWFMTLFGRDSLLTAWMSLPLDVGLSIGTLQQLAGAQGRRVDPLTEEQPGRILHEIRRGPASADVLGGSTYYGSIDSTPLFVMLLAECWRWGGDEEQVRALVPAADAALAWATRYGDRDDDGFIEYRRATDRGLINQGWKDSFDAISDAAGHLADPPIALCEVQGYQYAALRARADLADAFGEPATAGRLRDRAAALQSRFADAFWLPDRGYYALALDGDKRPVDSLTSNVGHCLWTGIATDEHVAVMVERLAGEEMTSGFGLRTLATTMGAYNPMSYHNGSVWPHDTAIAVAGLLRYRHVPGAVELAERLAVGLLDAAAAFGGRLPELFCGFPRTQFHTPVPYPTSCSPQAWASAAPLLLVRSFLGLEPDVPHRRLTVCPQLPKVWGRVALTDLRLGEATVRIEAEGAAAEVTGLPEEWQLVTSQN
ncbi:amylo-alpha-1,6-glucosidase [Mycolicibacterium mageritense DSM 44476 = CIP 104973]|uniref:Amylo-alpha-1,6-glucosidase n=1 Tax=Mycolicibacterium mageritense TaxID=53462 RepID=A0AAI8XLK5_MYCME|nr:glycogen debranching N-terminal domain-containing protein [Mycolicibacterium mageritense]OKH77853.1 amylo-alpha-1,6-glucosidase [Mycobacterium sp. SWH-M3]MCC9180232.1 amylo-alpha-1,6-glucosidase [Mycolicibacterium mageritense]TXI64840.1 MAG: amylo-alpha-1,6-glucosidase [Mycolicibacterium mageritense]CDO23672.1 amylo-alpha-1,6-glucosidase [Mycolicibacterium mageritense DSM 44476 = CIP 104973]BBX31781.1 amylo-alpha-1,6-glucosidase [Mycolicibacterium mageritense]